jgi:F0F1-type ATP synthase epsilon subunit
MSKPADKQPTIYVKIHNAFTTFVEENCYSVSAVNTTGQFDVLPYHKNFISVLEPCDIAVVGPMGSQKVPIQQGVMYVRDNKVTVYLDV